MNVQSNVRIPSPLLRSLTSRMTRKRRKKVMEMRELSSELWSWGCDVYAQPTFAPVTSLPHALALPAPKSIRSQAPGWSGSISKDSLIKKEGRVGVERSRNSLLRNGGGLPRQDVHHSGGRYGQDRGERDDVITGPNEPGENDEQL